MGADGGSIAKRSEIVKVASQQNEAHDDQDKASAWTKCSLSKLPLQDPVVSDYSGSLYNRSAILELLLGSYSGPPLEHDRITQLRDVVTLDRKMMEIENPEKPALKVHQRWRVWIDQITRKRLDIEGATEDFAYLAECGHIAPVTILKAGNNCPVCETSFADYVILNPRTTAATNHNEDRIKTLKGLGIAHNLRASKKKSIKRSNNDNETSSTKRVHT